jgi:hypothetical protein
MQRFRIVRVSPAVLVLASALSAQALDPGWAKLTPSPAAPALSAMAMAFDPVAGEMVLFGGDGFGGYSNATWTFDGAGWTHRVTPVAPPARAAASMAFDPVGQKLVLFGGFNGVHLGDTWLWDGATGTWARASVPVPPPAVTGPALFNDPVDGRVEMFGGFDGQFYHLDTYRWDGGVWQQLATAHTPSARAAAVVANDPTHGTVLLFGGLASVNPWNTWLWDGQDWLQQAPALQPPNRYDGAGAWDAQLGGVVIFGGGAAGNDVRDTWEWTGNEWVQLVPSVSPPARESHGMAWDPALGRILVVGGAKGSTTYSDTWSFVEPGSFADLGPGLGGAAGVPVLSCTGDLTPGSGLGFTLRLAHAPPLASAVLLLGLTPSATPVLGGTLYVLPVLKQLSLPCDASGSALLHLAVPATFPAGAHFVLQAWMPDASAPRGAAASNGVRATCP